MTRKSEKLLTDLVEAFTELGPAWGRWVNACIPTDAVSYARMRLLTVLECDDNQTMSQLAEALAVTPRRVTDLVDALEADGLVTRHPHPKDGRSTLVTITEEGLKHQKVEWKRLQTDVSIAFGDLTPDQQAQLLQISRDLTVAFRARLSERTEAEATA